MRLKEKLSTYLTKSRKRWNTQLAQLKLKTPICKFCGNPIESNSFHSLISDSPKICYKCYSSLTNLWKSFSLDGVKGFGLFRYDDNIRGMIYQFKGCYDYELAPIFLEYNKNYFRYKFKNYVVVPAPSSKESNELRGFNHVIEIFTSLGLEIIPCIEKIDNVKQSDLSHRERKSIGSHLNLQNKTLLRNKKVLLCDDVMTTGSTLKAMIKLVRSCSPKDIKIFVISIRQNATQIRHEND